MTDKLTNEQFERLFESAVVRNFEESLAKIPPQEELENSHTFSERHNSRMEKLIRRVRRDDMRKTVFLWARKAGTAAAVIIAFFSVTLFSFSPDVRAAVSEVIIRWHENFTQFISRAPDAPIDEPFSWRPQYLPQGFEETDVIDLGDTVMIIFANHNGDEISLTIIQHDGSISISNEGMEFRQVTDEIGTVFQQFIALNNRLPSTIVWHKDYYSFALASEISIDELQAVAQSVVR